nr:thiol reductant ABC exporter subunit CydC [Auritidibacter ignavus]
MGLGVLAVVKALGWILIAIGIARGISQLAASLPTQDAAQLIDLFFNPPATSPGIVESLAQAAFTAEFLAAVVTGFGGAVLRGVAVWGQQVLASRAALGEKEHLRAQLVTHRLNAAGEHADRAGEDAVLASKGLDGLDKYYTEFLPALLSALVIPVLLGGWILLHDWVSALILVITVPLIPVFMILIGRYTESRVDDATAGLNRLSHHLLELARGLPVLVGLRRAGVQRKSLATVSEKYQRITMSTLRAAFMSSLALELIATLSVAVIAVLIGVRLVYGGLELSVGLMVLTLAAEVYLPFRDVGSAFHSSEDGVDALRRAREQINQPEAKTLAESLRAESTYETGTVSIDNLSIAYRSFTEITAEKLPDIRALHHDDPRRAKVLAHKNHAGPTHRMQVLDPVVTGLSLRLAPGEITVFGSASGTGKSTVLNALAGVLTEAEAEFRGRVSGLDELHVAWLAQHPNFSEPTVAEELEFYVRLDRPEATADTVESLVAHALATSGLADYQSRIVNDLSPGERRRLGFARVVIRLLAAGDDTHGWLLILDEPTAHLDPASADAVRDTLATLRQRRLPKATDRTHHVGETPLLPPITMVVASHDPEVHHLADHVVDGARVTTDARTVQTVTHAAATPVADTVSAGARITDQAEHSATTPQRSSPDHHRAHQPHDTENHRLSLGQWFRFLPLNRGKFLAGVFWSAAAVLSAALLSALSGWLIVQASYQPPILYLLAIIVAVRFFGIGRAVFRYAERLAVHDAVLSWADDLRLKIWDALGSQAQQWTRLTRTGGALSVLISDVDELRDAVPRVIVPIPAAVIAWLATLGITMYFAPGAWWPALVAGLFGVVVIPCLVALSDARSTAMLADHRTQVMSQTSRLLTAAADLAGNGGATVASERFARWDLHHQRPLKRHSMVAGLGQGLSSLVCGWAAIQIMWECVQHGINAPHTALVVMMMLALAEPFGLLNQGVQEFSILRRQLQKIGPLLETSQTATGGWVQVEAVPAPPAIDDVAEQKRAHHRDVVVSGVEVDQIDVAYAPHGPLVLADLSVRATRGDFCVVTGPSGSGKSTLLAVLLGFLRPQSGRMVLHATRRTDATESGTDSSIGPESALGAIAWCPQEAYLFDSTLRSNLALARDPDDRPEDAELIRALKTVGLADWLEVAPNGLDTRLGPSGHFVSGGQRQRIAVARALIARADVVLLDEPTAHLGADEAAHLVADLKKALADRTVVMVTHDSRFATAGNQAVTLG